MHTQLGIPNAQRAIGRTVPFIFFHLDLHVVQNVENDKPEGGNNQTEWIAFHLFHIYNIYLYLISHICYHYVCLWWSCYCFCCKHIISRRCLLQISL